jgi:hypothetical protein
MLKTEFQFRCTKHSVNLKGRPRFTIANGDVVHYTFKVDLGGMWCPSAANTGTTDCRGSWTDRALKADGPKECHVMTCWNYTGKWFNQAN